MKTRTKVNAGATVNHNQSMPVRIILQAGATVNHTRGMKVRSNVKGGHYPVTMDPLPWMGKN